MSLTQTLQFHRSAVCCNCDSDHPGHVDARKEQHQRQVINVSGQIASGRVDDERDEAGIDNHWSTAGFPGPIVAEPVFASYEGGDLGNWVPAPIRDRGKLDERDPTSNFGVRPALAAVPEGGNQLRWDSPRVLPAEQTTSTTASRDAPRDFCRPLSAHLGRYTSTRALADDIEVTQRKLGEGRAGGVYLATRRLNGAPCAVKTLNKDAVNFEMLKEFRNEVEIFASLDHPYVARLEGVYETESQVHLVMEHLGAGDVLAAIRAAGPQGFGEARAAVTVRQMLLAVAYLHRLRVSHRDLKPVHFMYASEGGSVKLIDFSLSQRLGRASKFDKAAGTLEYMAPEVKYGGASEKADVWALGVIAHRLLVGSKPSRPSTGSAISRREQAPPPLTDLLQGLPQTEGGRFVTYLLNEDPARRPSALEALRHTWLSTEFPEAPLDPSPAMLRRLKRFACEDCGLRRTALEVAARLLATKGAEELGAQFLILDRDKGGTASLEDFEAYARRCRSKLREPMVRDIFRGLAEGDDGKITYGVFLAAAVSAAELDDGAARVVFQHLDEDGDGAITSRDVAAILSSQPRKQAALKDGEEGIGADAFVEMLLKDSLLFPESPCGP